MLSPKIMRQLKNLVHVSLAVFLSNMISEAVRTHSSCPSLSKVEKYRRDRHCLLGSHSKIYKSIRLTSIQCKLISKLADTKRMLFAFVQNLEQMHNKLSVMLFVWVWVCRRATPLSFLSQHFRCTNQAELKRLRTNMLVRLQQGTSNKPYYLFCLVIFFDEHRYKHLDLELLINKIWWL